MKVPVAVYDECGGAASARAPQHVLQRLTRHVQQPGGGAPVAGAAGQRLFQHGASHQLFDALHRLVSHETAQLRREVGLKRARRIDSGGDRVAVEWLAHERANAALRQAKSLFGLRDAADADDDGLRADRVELVDEVERGAVWQCEVEHDEFWSFFANRAASLRERSASPHANAGLGEEVAKFLPQPPAVVDDECILETNMRSVHCFPMIRWLRSDPARVNAVSLSASCRGGKVGTL